MRSQTSSRSARRSARYPSAPSFSLMSRTRRRTAHSALSSSSRISPLDPSSRVGSFAIIRCASRMSPCSPSPRLWRICCRLLDGVLHRRVEARELLRHLLGLDVVAGHARAPPVHGEHAPDRDAGRSGDSSQLRQSSPRSITAGRASSAGGATPRWTSRTGPSPARGRVGQQAAGRCPSALDAPPERRASQSRARVAAVRTRGCSSESAVASAGTASALGPGRARRRPGRERRGRHPSPWGASKGRRTRKREPLRRVSRARRIASPAGREPSRSASPSAPRISSLASSRCSTS